MQLVVRTMSACCSHHAIALSATSSRGRIDGRARTTDLPHQSHQRRSNCPYQSISHTAGDGPQSISLTDGCVTGCLAYGIPAWRWIYLADGHGRCAFRNRSSMWSRSGWSIRFPRCPGAQVRKFQVLFFSAPTVPQPQARYAWFSFQD